MKNLFFTITLLLFVTTNVAQTKKSKIAAIIGLNTSGYSTDPLGTSAFLHSFSFHIGGSYEQHISNKFSLKSGLVYSQLGDREVIYENIKLETGDPLFQHNINYLTAPIDFIYNFRDYRIFIGPQFGLFLGQDKVAKYFGEIQPIDFGISLGYGKIFDNKLSIDLRLYQGLTKIYKSTNYIGSFNLKNASNQVMQISFGYYLN